MKKIPRMELYAPFVAGFQLTSAALFASPIAPVSKKKVQLYLCLLSREDSYVNVLKHYGLTDLRLAERIFGDLALWNVYLVIAATLFLDSEDLQRCLGDLATLDYVYGVISMLCD